MTSILEIKKLEPKYYEPDKFPKGLNKKVVESISHIKMNRDGLQNFD